MYNSDTQQSYKDRNEYTRAWRRRDPEKNKAVRFAWCELNREKIRAQNKAQRQKNPEKTKAAERRKAFLAKLKHHNMTEDEYTALWKQQNESCAICSASHLVTKHGWHLDHDHTDGRIRGILCQTCNTMLGHAKDDPSCLRAGALYLEKPPCR